MPIDPAGVSEADPFPWEAESEGEADMNEFRGMCVCHVYTIYGTFICVYLLYILSTLLHAPPVYTTIVGYTHYAYSIERCFYVSVYMSCRPKKELTDCSSE